MSCEVIMLRISFRRSEARKLSGVMGKKKPQLKAEVLEKIGDDLLFHLSAVSSAREGLTSLFGMGRGEHLR